MRRILQTADEVIDALGGSQKVADLTGRPIQAVTNWRKRGLPAESFGVLTDALAAAGYSAPRELWSMIPTPSQTIA